MLNLIEKIEKIETYKLWLRFNTGELLEIDLEEKIRNKSTTADSKYKMLLNPSYFQQVKLHPEWQTIYWPNGLDFCPDVLYTMGRPVATEISEK